MARKKRVIGENFGQDIMDRGAELKKEAHNATVTGHAEKKKGRNIYRVNYPKLNGEVDIFLQFKEFTFTEMMNFYFNIYDDLTN